MFLLVKIAAKCPATATYICLVWLQCADNGIFFLKTGAPENTVNIVNALMQDLGKNPATAPYLDLLKIFAYETYSTCFKQGVRKVN